MDDQGVSARFKDLMALQKRLEEMLIDEKTRRATEVTCPQLNQRLESTERILLVIQQKILRILEQIQDSSEQKNNSLYPQIVLDFPRFDGTKPRAWVWRCNMYFEFFKSIPPEDRVQLAAYYFEGCPDLWFQGLKKEHTADWNEFSKAVITRFDEEDLEELFAEFQCLEQVDTVEVYLRKFEELKPYVMEFLPELGESFYVAKFICGLQKAIRILVSVRKPETMMDAISQARLHERAVNALLERCQEETEKINRSL